MCNSLVSPHGLKNDECYICSVLVSPHGFENDVYFIVAHFFRLMAWRTTYISLSLANWPTGSPINSCQDELSPSDPIEFVCQHFQPPSLLLTSDFRIRSSALRSFPVPVAIGFNLPAGEDNPTHVGCTGHVCRIGFRSVLFGCWLKTSGVANFIIMLIVLSVCLMVNSRLAEKTFNTKLR